MWFWISWKREIILEIMINATKHIPMLIRPQHRAGWKVNIHTVLIKVQAILFFNADGGCWNLPMHYVCSQINSDHYQRPVRRSGDK